jgi:hypothetical protein
VADFTTNSFQYGDLVLTNVQTQNYRVEQVTDNANLDVIKLRHSVTVRGLLAPGAAPAISGERGPDIIERLKTKIRKRRYLLYAIAGKVILKIGDEAAPTDPAKNFDIGNGPTLESITAVTITETSIIVELTLTAETPACTDAERKILSHRWSQRVEYDEAGYAVWTTDGTIYLRGDKFTSTPEIIREAGIMPRQKGFDRKSATFGLADDGLSLRYTIVDHEFFLGKPGESARCEIKTSIGHLNAANCFASCTVSLRGVRNLKLSYHDYFFNLYRRALIIIEQYLRPFRFEIDGKAQVQSFTFERDVMRGEISVSAKCLADPQKIQKDGNYNLSSICETETVLSGLAYEGAANASSKATGLDLDTMKLVEHWRAAAQDPCGSLVKYTPNTPKEPEKPNANAEQPPETTPTVTGGFTPSEPSNDLDGGTLTGGAAMGFAAGSPAAETESGASARPAPEAFGGNSVAAMNSQSQTGAESPAPVFADVRAPYDVCVFECDVQIEEGLTVVPSAAKPTLNTSGKVVPPRAIKVRQHQPFATLTVAFSMKRAGVRPLLPDPTPGHEDLVLLSRKITESNVDQKPSGEYEFSIAGVYRYAFLDVALAREISPLMPLVIQGYGRNTKHVREPYKVSHLAIWHTFKKFAEMPDWPGSQILGAIEQPPKPATTA